jgi:1-acyl-sn-glycerol-3-phosphate acyltransferase
MDALRSLGWFIANVWHAFFLLVWSVICMTIATTAGLLGFHRFAFLMAPRAWCPGLLWACGVTLDVRGADKVDWSKPHVIVVNHQSMIDIPALQLGLPTLLRFITKKELMSVPFLGHFMRSVGMISVDRGNTAEGIQQLKAQAKRMSTDIASVLAFAEGTRSRTGEIKSFRKGAFMLAIEAGVPVVPVSIEGARRVLPPDGFKVRPGVIRIDVGDPIATTDMTHGDREPLMRRAHDVVVAMNVAAGGLGASSVEIDMGRGRTSALGAHPRTG